MADKTLVTRQALITGRLVENITDNAFKNYEMTLRYEHDTGSGTLPVTLHRKAGGYFVLQLSPQTAFPDFSDFSNIVLTVTATIADAGVFEQTIVVSAAELELETATIDISGTEKKYLRIAAAPFSITMSVPPKSVSLKGHVLKNHDPASPLEGATITMTPVASPASITSNAEGMFFVPDLPLAKELTLTATAATASFSTVFRPDYAKPVNTIVLSLPDT